MGVRGKVVNSINNAPDFFSLASLAPITLC